MSSLQAALGLAQLERADELIEKKREIFSWYQSRIGDLDQVELNGDIPNGKNSYWMVTVLVDESCQLDKYTVIQRMREAGVICRPFFNPLSSLDAYKNEPSSSGARKRNPVSYSISERGINLPSGFNLTEEDVDYIVQELIKALQV
jgi:perosamine synthetase